MNRLSLFTLSALACAWTSAGLAQSSAVRLEIVGAAQPQLAVGATGQVWLVYGRAGEAAAAPVDRSAHASQGASHKAKGHEPGSRSGALFVARSDDGGVTFGPASKVAALPKLMLGMRRGPRLAVHGNRITVTAIADELVSFTSTDSGRTWGPAVTINEVRTSAREGLHDLAGGPAGELFVTWLDLRNGTMELWGASSKDGGRSWARNEQVYKSPDKSVCECCHPSALFDTDGNLAVMWRNSIAGARDMWMAIRAKDAAGFGPARKIGEGTWRIAACPMDGGGIVALGGGDFGAVFQRNGEVFISRGGDETNLGRGKQPVAVHSGNARPKIVWQQGTDLVALKGLSGAAPAKLADEARFPSVVALPGGRGVLLAYERGPAKGATSIAIERL